MYNSQVPSAQITQHHPNISPLLVEVFYSSHQNPWTSVIYPHSHADGPRLPVLPLHTSHLAILFKTTTQPDRHTICQTSSPRQQPHPKYSNIAPLLTVPCLHNHINPTPTYSLLLSYPQPPQHTITLPQPQKHLNTPLFNNNNNKIIIIISLFPNDRCMYKPVFISSALHMKKEEAEVQYLWGASPITK